MAFADILVVDRHLEAKSVGIEVVARHHRAFTPALLARWKRWFAQSNSANWATTDHICGALIGPLLVHYPRAATRLRSWSTHPNMWVRRASIVGLIPLARKGVALDQVYGFRATIARRRRGPDSKGGRLGASRSGQGRRGPTGTLSPGERSPDSENDAAIRDRALSSLERARSCCVTLDNIADCGFGLLRPQASIAKSNYQTTKLPNSTHHGTEAKCAARMNRKSASGTARLETDVLQFRGDGLKLSIPFRSMTAIVARDGELRVTWPDGTAALDLGAAAEKWADKIRNPPSRLQKIGVKPDWTASVLGVEDTDFLKSSKAQRPRSPSDAPSRTATPFSSARRQPLSWRDSRR